MKLILILGLYLISNISYADFPASIDCSTASFVGQRNRLQNNTYGFCQISSCKDASKSVYKNQCVSAPTVSFMPTKNVVVEGEGSFTIRAQLSRATSEAISFPISSTESIGEVVSDPNAQPGTADFQISGSMNFSAGQTISDPMEVKLFKKPGFSSDRVLSLSIGPNENQKVSIKMVDSEQAPGNTYRVINSPILARENELATPLQFGFEKPLSRIFPTRLKVKVGQLTYNVFVQKNQLLSDIIQIPLQSIPVGVAQAIKIESLAGTQGVLTVGALTYTAGFSTPLNTVTTACSGTVTTSGTVNSCVRDYDHQSASLSLCSGQTAPAVTYKSPAGTILVGAVSNGTAFLTCAQGETTGTASKICDAGHYLNGLTCENVGAGYYSSVNNTRVACPTNSTTADAVSTSNTSCLANAGYYESSPGVFTSVGAGYISTALNSGRTACPAGTYSSSATASSCSACTNTPTNSSGATYSSSDTALTSNSCTYASVTCSAGYGKIGNACFLETYTPVYTNPPNPLTACQGQSTFNKVLSDCIHAYGTFSESVATSFCPQTLPTVTLGSPAGTKNNTINHGTNQVTCSAGSTTETITGTTCDSNAVAANNLCYLKTTSVAVALFGNSLFVEDLNGKVLAAGNNTSANLGDGTKVNKTSPVEITALANAKLISTATDHTCAIMADNIVKCVGQNGSGQLGDSTTVQKTTPINIPAFSGATSITSYDGTTCAVMADSNVKCAGSSNAFNRFGQLIGDLPTATVISGFTGAKKVALTTASTCVLMTNNTVKCIGKGYLTEAFNYNTPTVIAGFNGATDIYGGQSNVCVLLANSTLKCMGSNYNGEFGIPGGNDELTPVLSGFGAVTSFSLGITSCASIADGSVICSGDNSTGLIGGAPLASQILTPVTVAGFVGTKKVYTDFNKICAILNDDSLVCKGSGTDIGTRLTPSRIGW